MKISTRSYCYLLLWFGFIVLCSHLTPYFANDYRYLLISGTHDLVTSVQDIFISQYHHYFEWGGRTVAHVIAQFLLYVGKPASAVCTALCYVLLVLFIYYHAYGIRPTLKIRLKPLVLITILLFLQLRAYGEVVFNIVSSANYLYVLLLVLMFLLPYRISMQRELVVRQGLFSPLIFLLGILAGWSNEATGAAVAAGLGLYLLFNLKEHKLTIWQCVGYAGFLMGFALMILAPGNQARLDSMEDHGFDYFGHVLSAIEIFFETLLVCGFLVVLVGFLLYKIYKERLHHKDIHTFYGSVWFIATGFFSLFLMVFSPNFPIRTTTTFVIFSVIGILGLSLIVYTHNKQLLPHHWENRVVLLLEVFTLSIMINMVWAYSQLHESMKVRNGELFAQLDSGQEHIVVEPLALRTYKYMYVADVRANKDYWTNKIVSNFYQVEDIVRTKDLKPNKVHYDWQFYTGLLDDSDFIEPAGQAPESTTQDSQEAASEATAEVEAKSETNSEPEAVTEVKPKATTETTPESNPVPSSVETLDHETSVAN